MKKHFLVAIAIATLLILVGGVALFFRYASLGDPPPPPAPIPPPIATTTNDTLWKTFTDQETGISFRYPNGLLPEFITAPIWPPKIRVATGTLSCVEKLEDRGESTTKRTIDTQSYCVTEQSEGAAGSVYTTYTYQVEKERKVISVDFTLRAVQCANYDEPKKTVCGEERESFDLDSIVDKIVESVKLPQ
jgi:hypothetical protein